jgi:hypothetical protein
MDTFSDVAIVNSAIASAVLWGVSIESKYCSVVHSTIAAGIFGVAARVLWCWQYGREYLGRNSQALGPLNAENAIADRDEEAEVA